MFTESISSILQSGCVHHLQGTVSTLSSPQPVSNSARQSFKVFTSKPTF